MTGNEKFRLKVVDDLRKNRVIVESDEDYITLLKKANKDLGDLVRLRDEQIAKLTAERDKATQYWQIAEGRCDALIKKRDDLLSALENCRLLAARHRNEDWAGHVIRFCSEAGVKGEVMRDA